MAPLSSLPTEIVSLIVENFHRKDLYACTLTNKQIYKATLPHLWHAPALTEKDTVLHFLKGLTAASMLHHQDPGQWIRKLTLYNDYWTDAQLLTLMAHDLSQVEELRLVSTKHLTDASLTSLPGHCVHLKTLYLWDVRGVTPAFVAAVGQSCIELTKFEFYDCPGLDGNTYADLWACPLRAMYIASPPRRLQGDKAMWDLIVHFPALTELKVCIPPEHADSAFVPRLLSAAVTAWPALTSLALHGYRDNDGGHGLVDFLRYHPGLTRLYLRQCHLSTPTMQALAAVCMPYLHELAITDTKTPLCPHALRRLIGNWPQLGFVLCRGCELTALMFPEAGIKCANWNHSHFFVHHLDQDCIHKVRFGDDNDD